MQPSAGALAYCGATIWRDKYALPVLGGHGNSHDDGGYALDLVTGLWETIVAPTGLGTSTAAADALGEYAGGANRPASQHTYAHLVTVGNDMVQVNGTAVGFAATGSKQAHRWNHARGAWERYGTNTGGISPNGGAFTHYDPVRNRLVRISLYGSSGAIDTIPANSAAADWSAQPISVAGRASHNIACAMGYHTGLDCYVLISPGEFTPSNRVFVMDPDNLRTGWVAVAVNGDMPPALSSPGLEYCPPMRAMVTVDHTASDKLFYVKPTGGRTDPWIWSSEIFTGSSPSQSWANGLEFSGVYRRFVWSDLLRGFVMCKAAASHVEVYVPSEVAAYYS